MPLMNWLNFTSDSVMVSQGIAESKRFGFTIVNFKCGARLRDIQVLSDAIAASDFDLAVVRYPSGKIEFAEIIEPNKYRVVLTDPTVYWKNKKSLVHESTDDQFQLSEVTSTDISSVEHVVDSAFNDYQSHWQFNPRTKDIEMSEAYSEWVVNSIENPSIHVFLMSDTGAAGPIGIAMVQIEGNVLEIMLAGIVKERQGQALYGRLLTHLTNFGSARGVDQVVISTQASNINVQKAWITQGWVPSMTIHTLHLEKYEFTNTL